ncbi:MAG: ATP-binding protein [Bacilli bacterium]|nr:ATP-binding protein [Bacilli bacterium]
MKEFDKVIGYKSIKIELERICDWMINPEKYKKLGVNLPGGLLLYGEPGVGKTLFAGCFIEAAKRKAYICRKNEPNGDFVKTIKKTFDDALGNAPSIVVLDDLDKFANEDEDHKNAEEFITVQSCIDDIKGKDVFVLATANDLTNFPRSILRAGRFDKSIKVNNPTGEDCVKIVRYYLSQKKNVKDIDAREIARILNGKSCAELETVVNEAGIYAGFQNKRIYRHG